MKKYKLVDANGKVLLILDLPEGDEASQELAPGQSLVKITQAEADQIAADQRALNME